MRPLRHRRALLAAIDQLNDEEAAGTPHAGHVGGTFSSLPEFGRVLTHLSNVRTAHSWCRLAVQQLILALGVVRLGVVEAADERDVLYRLVLAVCAAWCVVGVGFAVYGGWRFLRVTSILDSAEMQTSKCVRSGGQWTGGVWVMGEASMGGVRGGALLRAHVWMADGGRSDWQLDVLKIGGGRSVL